MVTRAKAELCETSLEIDSQGRIGSLMVTRGGAAR